MNKYLMMSAAFLLATSAGALADNAAIGDRSFHFGSSAGGSFCDGGKAHWSAGVYTWTHVMTGCGYSNFVGGTGIVGDTKRIGNNVNMFDTYSPLVGFECSFDFPAHIKIGGIANIWCNGQFAGSVTILDGPPKHQPGKKSVYTMVAAALAKKR